MGTDPLRRRNEAFDRLREVEELIERKSRVLHQLHLRAAPYGSQIMAPANIKMSIEDTEKELAALRQERDELERELAVSVPVEPDSAQRRHLETQRIELQGRYDTLTKRIAALNTDIGRELDSERRLTLEDRRAELVTQRDSIQDRIVEIEIRLRIRLPAESEPKPPSTTPPPPPDSRPDSVPPTRFNGTLFIWAIAGALLVTVVGSLFFRQVRCLVEYRLSEAVMGLIAFLALGAGFVFTHLAPRVLRPKLQALYGGLALSLLVLVIAILAMPPASGNECLSTPIPALDSNKETIWVSEEGAGSVFGDRVSISLPGGQFGCIYEPPKVHFLVSSDGTTTQSFEDITRGQDVAHDGYWIRVSEVKSGLLGCRVGFLVTRLSKTDQ